MSVIDATQRRTHLSFQLDAELFDFLAQLIDLTFHPLLQCRPSRPRRARRLGILGRRRAHPLADLSKSVGSRSTVVYVGGISYGRRTRDNRGSILGPRDLAAFTSYRSSRQKSIRIRERVEVVSMHLKTL